MLNSCRHVDEFIGTKVCPYCGLETNDIDWSRQIELHQEWVRSGKAEYLGWVSI